jgi:polyisoprenoid-binding protein YceI
MARTITLSLLLASWQVLRSQAQTQERAYSVATNGSTLTIFVGKSGALKGLGHEHIVAVKSFSGEAHIPSNALGGASFALEIDAGSLSVIDEGISDKDRMEIESSMKSKVLDVSRFPKIRFQSDSITNIKPTTNGQTALLNGHFTLHGVTNQVTVPAAITITPEQLRVSGDVKIKQTDFGIKPYSTAGGTVKVRNELKIRFSVIAKPSASAH